MNFLSFLFLQEGQVANMEDVENVLTKDQIKQLQVRTFFIHFTLITHCWYTDCMQWNLIEQVLKWGARSNTSTVHLGKSF